MTQALALRVPGIITRTLETKVYPPSIDGLLGLYFLGGTLEESLVNRSPNPGVPPKATVVGTPTVSDDGVTIKNLTNYLDTGIAETDEMTLIAWHTKANLTFNAISNSYYTRQSGTGYAYGLALRVTGGSDSRRIYYARMGVRASSSTTANGSSVNSNSGQLTTGDELIAVAGRFTENGVEFFNLSDGTKGALTGVGSGNVRDKCGATFKIGTEGVGGANDTAKVCGVAIYNRALSDDELAIDFSAWLKTYEARTRGLVL